LGSLAAAGVRARPVREGSRVGDHRQSTVEGLTGPLSLLLLGLVVGGLRFLAHVVTGQPQSEDRLIATDSVHLVSLARGTALLLAAPAISTRFGLFLT
jgi:hypothetical protein